MELSFSRREFGGEFFVGKMNSVFLPPFASLWLGTRPHPVNPANLVNPVQKERQDFRDFVDERDCAVRLWFFVTMAQVALCARSQVAWFIVGGGADNNTRGRVCYPAHAVRAGRVCFWRWHHSPFGIRSSFRHPASVISPPYRPSLE
jgi:hypothetical protein